MNDKKPEMIMKAIHRTLCMDLGFLSVGFWCDNSGEVRDSEMEEFVNELGLRIDFRPAYSPWSNSQTELNHASVDKTIKKMLGDRKVSLSDSLVNAADGPIILV